MLVIYLEFDGSDHGCDGRACTSCLALPSLFEGLSGRVADGWMVDDSDPRGIRISWT